MSDELDPQAVNRLADAADETLRRLGFTERTIKRHRRATRAQIAAHLHERTSHD